jgi:hypothetical protein
MVVLSINLFEAQTPERALAAGQAGNVPMLLLGGTVGGSGTSAAPAGGSRSRRAVGITQRCALDEQMERVGCFSKATPS